MITTFDSQHLISQAHLKRKKKKPTIYYSISIHDRKDILATKIRKDFIPRYRIVLKLKI